MEAMTTETGITWTDFAEGRRGYRGSDLAALPKRNGYASESEAVAAMADNDIAFRVYSADGRISLGILSTYYRVKRAKPSQPWKQDATALCSCAADAIDQLGDMHGNLSRVLSAHDWIALQSKQHLRAVGIRS